HVYETVPNQLRTPYIKGFFAILRRLQTAFWGRFTVSTVIFATVLMHHASSYRSKYAPQKSTCTTLMHLSQPTP
ncbi:MAG: hypothetical protein LBJ12_03465, partial [Oscillospiraceae bacterium]|nr:hypothetical protein [Oscillospiraceae bacterium]